MSINKMLAMLGMFLGVVGAASAVTITQPVSEAEWGSIATGLTTSATTAITAALPIFVIGVALVLGVKLFRKLAK